ncbi:MAG: Nickel and cobalt resistance protein CnrB [Pseudomonadota bacterium]|jgi:RND family efflux transporter MFP subunit
MKKSTLWILSGVALAVLVAGGARLIGQRKAAATASSATVAAPALELAKSDVYTVSTQAMALGLPVSGALKATQSAFIKARVAGELVELNVREGDTVQAGQVVARVDPTEYQARQRQAQQQADSAKAQVDIAQRQYDNNKALVDQGFISQTALITSQASLNGAKATHMAAVAALDVAHKALDDASLKAPFAGQISQRLAQAGERVAPDARIVEIVNLAQLELEAALPANDAAQVRVGMKAQLQVEGLSQPVEARVLRINPSAQAGSRSVLVYLGVAGRAGLRQGLFAEGALGTQTVQAMAVPLTSVRTDKPLPYVQVIEGKAVRHVSVKTGARTEVQGRAMVAVEGLTEGTQVLTASAGAVREGVQVKFTAAAQ